MVVQGILAMALALPTGTLFGLGYGTGVRIGYEQIYPLLFPKGARQSPEEAVTNLKSINQIYDLVGGKEASQMGIAMGILSAGEILKNPDFQVLEELESRLSGRTLSNLGKPSASAPPTYPSSQDSFFDQTYRSIQSMSLDQVISELSLAKQQKNGFSTSQNNTFLIPALETRLGQLRDSRGTTQTIAQQNTATLNSREPYIAPVAELSPQLQEYNIYNNKKVALLTKMVQSKNDYAALIREMQGAKGIHQNLLIPLIHDEKIIQNRFNNIVHDLHNLARRLRNSKHLQNAALGKQDEVKKYNIAV